VTADHVIIRGGGEGEQCVAPFDGSEIITSREAMNLTKAAQGSAGDHRGEGRSVLSSPTLQRGGTEWFVVEMAEHCDNEDAAGVHPAERSSASAGSTCRAASRQEPTR